MRSRWKHLAVSLSATLLAGLGARAAGPPVGLAAIERFDRIAEVGHGVRTYQASSYDRTGGNADTGHFLRIVGNERVLLDVKGPGCISRIWMTGIDLAAPIRIYFDGAAVPTVHMSLGDFFSGQTAPFLAPLVGNDDVSSGGFICYLPMPFRQGCRITTESYGHYYNITYQRFDDAEGVVTFTGTEDSTAARALWENVGRDPKLASPQRETSGAIALPAGMTATLLDVDGGGVVEQIEVVLPGMWVDLLTDDGRAHQGYSQFTLAIHPDHTGVRLTRRLDYHIGNQKANVLVDGAPAGEWYTPGSSPQGMWLNSSFEIPPALTAGKSAITVRIVYVSSDLDWNEFSYWVDCAVNGELVRTDLLDVGQPASEAAHQYSIETDQWFGWRTFHYYQPTNTVFRELLKNIRLVATWDEADAPAVDVPLGGFFGSNLAPQRVRGLPAGIEEDRLYCYFPMPYAKGARLQLVNTGLVDAAELHYVLRYTPREDEDLLRLGRFHAKFNAEKPTTQGRDYIILEETGTGHLVGVIQTMQSPDASRWYLEGDERIYVDGSRTPSLYGTGTEDFYNGGWYFNRGLFTLPVHGNPANEIDNGRDTTDCYRFFLSDRIPFASSIKVGIEHGGVNEFLNDIWSVALYYKLPQPTALLSDQLDVGSPASEEQHGYVVTGQVWAGDSTYRYEGDDDHLAVQDHGRRIGPSGGESGFTFRIDPDAEGVLLRRRLDYGIPEQEAEVYVDGELAGIWYDAGSNPYTPFRDSEFMIPPALTRGKSAIALRFRNVSPTSEWTEYHYWVWSLVSVIPRPRGDFDRDGDVDQSDFGFLQACLSNPPAPPAPGCERADFDGDGWVGKHDVTAFRACMSGPRQAAPEECVKSH